MSNTNDATTDLTVVFLTANEHPEHWTEFHKQKLLEATEGFPMITSSIKPLDFGLNILQTEPYSHSTMYRQLLKAAKLASTPYVAVAESDCLYPREHFTFYRPPLDAVAYDMSKWSLYTWGTHIYSIRRRVSNCSLIAPREYLIEALEERYGDNSKCPRDERVGEVGRHIHEKALGITPRNAVEVWCHKPMVVITHPNALGYKQAHHPTQKKLGELKAFDIEVWGKASELIKEYR